MKTKIIIVLLTITVISCATYTKHSELDAWTELGDVNWSSKNGVTESIIDSGEGFLVSTKKYSNFLLEIDFYPTAEVNSGIFIACQNPQKLSFTDCHEINIWDNHPKQEYRTGAIVAKVFPPLVQIHTLDKWNTYSIRIDKGNVTVHLNGIHTAQLNNEELGAGYLAVQKAEGGQIKFRNLRITLL
ncbi:MAG: hypothetical protein ACI9FR_002340 [Cryomorphaceae bacterium]|jgi:hypothetical protein